MTEMPLLIFTLIEQTTVGAFAAMVIMHFMGKAKVGKTAFVTAAVLFVLAVAGMAASMAHLGQPLRALGALRGVGSSPLSHEILFFGAFVVMVAAYAFLAKAEKDGPAKIVGGIGKIKPMPDCSSEGGGSNFFRPVKPEGHYVGQNEPEDIAESVGRRLVFRVLFYL